MMQSTALSDRKPRSPAAARGRTARWHRWVGLLASILWLIQGVTGTLIVFHWELSDATLAGAHGATDLDRIEPRARALAPPRSDWTIGSIWTSAGAADRYDISLENKRTGAQKTVRISGNGTVLRSRDGGDSDLMDTFVVLHQTLLAGDAGGWIVGISGIILLLGLLLGLVTVWPRAGTWRRAFRRAKTISPRTRFLVWHRAIGLWAILPALVIAGAGVLLTFEDVTAQFIGAKDLTPPAAPGRMSIGIAQAARIAEQAIPGSTLTALASMPTPEDATYRIRLLAPGEWRRAYGKTTVYVDAANGTVRGVYSAAHGPFANRFMDALYAIHTGEVSGVAGRLLVMATGLWLVTMILLGLASWRRRSVKRP